MLVHYRILPNMVSTSLGVLNFLAHTAHTGRKLHLQPSSYTIDGTNGCA